MRRVLILRHGTSTWNMEHRWQGWLDAPLTAAGEEQAAARGRELAHDGCNPRIVYSSDLERARRTAEIIAAHLEVPVLCAPGFRERNGGEWQGHTTTEIDERWPGLRAAWRRGELHAPPGGEDDDQVFARFDDTLARAFDDVGRGQLLIVTHHGLLRLVATRAGVDVSALIPNLGGYWFDVENGALTNPEPVAALRVETEAPDAE